MQLASAIVLDGRVTTILGLIILDLGLGIAVAIREGVFDFSKLAQFYRTNVIPYLLGYIVVSASLRLIDLEWLGSASDIVGPGLTWAFWSFLVANLGAEIVKHVSDLGLRRKK